MNQLDHDESANVSRRGFLRGAGLVVAGGAVLTACSSGATTASPTDTPVPPLPTDGATPVTVAAAPTKPKPEPARPVTSDRIVADPTNIPGPVDWTTPKTHEVTLDAVEVVAEIEPGVTFSYMTFGGQVPGPMIRVRQGDTVKFTLTNKTGNLMPHNIDLHAVYGTGGGSDATTISPGQSSSMTFKTLYPGAFIYHCAVANLDYHISSGMYGMIVVEPPEGLAKVDHEFYVGQNEIYTDFPAGTKGHLNFNYTAMQHEDPTYVVLNGAKHGLTPDRFGAMQVKVGETARVFMVCGGPNLTSNFHPVGNVWVKAWREGALASSPERYVQTMAVAPGSCGVFEMAFPVPGRVELMDHAVTRAVSKGAMAMIQISGDPQPDIFNPGLPDDPAK